jgi:hypothetical protein
MVSQSITFIRNLALFALFAGAFVLATPVATAAPTDPSGGVLTNDQLKNCKDKWPGTYNLSNDAQREQYNTFKGSKCNAANDQGGNCKATSTQVTSAEDPKKKDTIVTIKCGSTATTGGGGGATQGELEDLSDPALSQQSCVESEAGANDCGFVDKYINPFIKLLNVLVGIVAIIFIIFGAIQVITSAGDPQKSANGKNHIRNALIGLVAYIILAAFLRWVLLPGALT